MSLTTTKPEKPITHDERYVVSGPYKVDIHIPIQRTVKGEPDEEDTVEYATIDGTLDFGSMDEGEQLKIMASHVSANELKKWYWRKAQDDGLVGGANVGIVNVAQVVAELRSENNRAKLTPEQKRERVVSTMSKAEKLALIELLLEETAA